MSASKPDVIDRLTGIEPFSHLAAIRAQRPATSANIQASYLALFDPLDPSQFSHLERYAVAAFVAALHRQPEASRFYAEGLLALSPDTNLKDALDGAARQAAARGPYGGDRPDLPSAEETGDLIYRVGEEPRRLLGSRITAAIEHAHLLVFHPRDSNPDALETLLDAGWSTTGIVTLSQLVSFLAFQLRVVSGLRILQTGA